MLSTAKFDSWDWRFLNQASLVSTWSKDPATKVGAVIALEKFCVGQGFNGFAQGVADTNARLFDKPTKLDLTIHAEINAILAAGDKARGATIYVYPLVPCIHCANVIIQAGIKRVCCLLDRPQSKKWEESGEKSKALFQEAGVEYIEEKSYITDQGDLFK